MVDLIPLRKKYRYQKLVRNDGPEGRTYGDEKLPSVTRILDATRDRAKIDEWVQRIGKEEAERIKTTAATTGTHMHNVIERMVAGKSLPRPTNWLMVKGYEMGYRLVMEQFSSVDEIWGSEITLYFPQRYAGTTDMVGIYKGKSAIIDFKQSNKPKRHEWITDYFHQLSAYALAHDALFGTNIEMGVIMVALQTGGTQVFTTTGHEFNTFKTGWLERVEKYHRGIKLMLPGDSGNNC
jgi:genome maintenance exonuclease 1